LFVFTVHYVTTVRRETGDHLKIPFTGRHTTLAVIED